MAFGERLRELRYEKNMTQKELSNVLFISERVISYYEKNERFPNDAATLIRIGEYFHVSVDYLLGITDVKNQDDFFGYSRDLIQLVQLYSVSSEHDKGRILQFADDLNNKNLHD